MSQERELTNKIKKLESDTGFKLRVLAQSYPNTPGARPAGGCWLLVAGRWGSRACCRRHPRMLHACSCAPAPQRICCQLVLASPFCGTPHPTPPHRCRSTHVLAAGKAIGRYWKVDENTIIFVADPTFGDILNFNVGKKVDTEVPQVGPKPCRWG